MKRRLERVLIVEDNVALRSGIARLVRSWDARPLEAGTARQAKKLLCAAPDLIIIDVALPDARADEILKAARTVSPTPIKVAISGEASAEEAFDLALLGVRRYLAKPFTLEELSAAVAAACSDAPEFEQAAADSVGHVSMHEMTRRVRRTMLEQALALAGGSSSGAARLLSVSRQAVQQMLRSRTLATPPPADGPRP